MNAIAETRGLCRQYDPVLRVSHPGLTMPEGAVYGFLGSDGMGKPTTLRLPLRLARPMAGEIATFGRPMGPCTRMEALRQVDNPIESPGYYGHLAGAESPHIVQTLRGALERSIGEVLRIVRLDGRKGERTARYSLDMKQRLDLAAALLDFPRLLILDEPTNDLDPAGIQGMRELIRSLPGRFDMTVVVSNHLLSEIDQMADHVGTIWEGKLMLQDTLSALHTRGCPHLTLRTTDNAGAARPPGENRAPCTLKDGWLTLPLLSGADTANLSRFLASRRVDPLRMEERQKSLEDLPLEFTGREESLWSCWPWSSTSAVSVGSPWSASACWPPSSCGLGPT